MAKSGYFFRVSPLDQHAEKLNTIIKDLIKQNIFSRVVRDAIRLYASLSEGQTDVLEELFPFVRNHYCGDTDPGERQKIIEETVKLVIKQQSQSRSSNNADIPDIRESGFPAMKQAGQGIGTLANRKVEFSLPIIDDENFEDTIVLNRSTDGSMADTVMANMLGLLGN